MFGICVVPSEREATPIVRCPSLFHLLFSCSLSLLRSFWICRTVMNRTVAIACPSSKVQAHLYGSFDKVLTFHHKLARKVNSTRRLP